jgi:2-iminobutanoate/2-iminopropanoate deaminase
MRLSIRIALLTAVFAAVAFPLSSAHAQAKREQVIPQGMSASPTLSPGIKIGNVVYSSGQLGLSRQNPDTTIQGQTRIALDNIKKVFESAGTTMSQAAKCTVFLTDLKDFSGMNEAYKSVFPDAPPARSTVVVAALVAPGAKVEIECIAAMP